MKPKRRIVGEMMQKRRRKRKTEKEERTESMKIYTVFFILLFK